MIARIVGVVATLALSACGSAAPIERRMEVGDVGEDGFRVYADGEILWVREAPQTGKWVMPSVRIWGVSGVARVDGNITLDDGRLAGGFRANLPFVVPDEHSDAMRFDQMPIPIGAREGGPRPAEVYGHTGTLSVVVDDARGAPVTWASAVRLENGDL
ncbi:hypothetical protein L6R52_11025 [Myxococcota bacterium]|nr:hypothetical protein [Myxococcota bacterium]